MHAETKHFIVKNRGGNCSNKGVINYTLLFHCDITLSLQF